MDVVTLAICQDVVDEAVENLEPGYLYKGSVATTDDLPASDNEKGDLWQVREDGSEYSWDGTQWVQRNIKAITNAYIDSLFG